VPAHTLDVLMIPIAQLFQIHSKEVFIEDSINDSNRTSDVGDVFINRFK